MSDALISSLQNRVNDLQGEVASLRAESKSRRLKLRDTTGELDSLRKQVADLTAQRDEFEARLKTDPVTADERVQALQRELKTRDAVDAFRSADLADGIKLDQVFKFFDVDPLTVDAAKATELLKGWREAAPGLFKQPDAAASQAKASEAPGGATKDQGKAGLDLSHLVGRGGRDAGSRSVTYTRAEVAQAGWERRRPELVEAIKNGTATLATE